MTENLYLILHKVRGEPAFDVAQRLEDNLEGETQLGEVWIIPTSGHRAYPFWTHPLNSVLIEGDTPYQSFPLIDAPLYETMPLDLKDHYAASEPIAKPAARPKPATATEDFVL